MKPNMEIFNSMKPARMFSRRLLCTAVCLPLLAALSSLILFSCKSSAAEGHAAYIPGDAPSELADVEVDSTGIVRQTYLFSCINSGSNGEVTVDSLYMDRYFVPADIVAASSGKALSGTAAVEPQPSPCMIFVFGGGFAGGARDRKMYMNYFRYLAHEGYNVMSIDYRLGMKPPYECDGSDVSLAKYMYGRLFSSIDIAVEDIYNATLYVILKSRDWNIDVSRIYLSGSSAGAIASLQAAYYISNGKCTSLDESFNYCGVVAFAGAIACDGNLKWGSRPAPMMLFAGDADANVPFASAETTWGDLHGSASVAASLDRFNSRKKNLKKGEFASYTFYSFGGADHSLAVSPMNQNLEEIARFLKECTIPTLPQTPVCRTVRSVDWNRPLVKREFKPMDYIMSNYGPYINR